MNMPPQDPFALTRIVVNRADFVLEACLRSAGFEITLGQLTALQAISRGSRSPTAIHKALGYATQQYVSKLLNDLRRHGYVECSQDSVDRRRLEVTLTSKGQQATGLCDGWLDQFDALAPKSLESAAATVLRGFDGLLDDQGFLRADI